MKRFVGFCLVLLIGCSLVGCGTTIEVNVDNSEELSSSELVHFIKINNTLTYDEATRIVYMVSIYNITPYYAPNGLPYRYNPETNTLEEIEWSVGDDYHQNGSCS